MTIRHSTLYKLLERLKSSAVRTIAKRKEKKRPKLAGVFESGESSSTQPSSPSLVSTNLISESNILPQTYVTVQASSPALSDHYVFYKGKAVGDMIEEPVVRQDGSIHMGLFRTMPGGDFNHDKLAWYWTKEEATAERYRQWGEIRCKYSETWIVQIEVPKTFIDSLRKETLWYSSDWKEYIWYCRKEGSAGHPPAKFDHLWKGSQAQFVEGHICMRAPAVIPRIKKEEVQEMISKDDVLYIGDRKATQSVFMDAEVVEQLGMLVRGKVYIDIHPAVYPLERA